MNPTPPAEVLVNGAPQPFVEGETVASLLERRTATGFGVAVERNGAVVRRAEQAQTPVEPGDRIEIVRLVGGG